MHSLSHHLSAQAGGLNQEQVHRAPGLHSSVVFSVKPAG